MKHIIENILLKKVLAIHATHLAIAILASAGVFMTSSFLLYNYTGSELILDKIRLVLEWAMMKANNKQAADALRALIPFLILIGLLLCIIGYRGWKKNEANSHLVRAKPQFYKVIGKSIVQFINHAYCEFNAHLSLLDLPMFEFTT